MTPIFLTDGSQRWFDLDTSTAFPQYPNGNPAASPERAPGDPDAGADPLTELYYTAGGKWILKTFGGGLAVFDSYIEQTHEEACKWLYIYGYDSSNTIHFRIA